LPIDIPVTPAAYETAATAIRHDMPPTLFGAAGSSRMGELTGAGGDQTALSSKSAATNFLADGQHS